MYKPVSRFYQMNLEVFAFCDAATDNAGKLNILGTFDTIFVKQAPANHGNCSVAMRLRFTEAEVGEHTFKLTIKDPDGGDVIPLVNGKLGVRINPGYDSATANLIFNLQVITLKAIGDYSVNFTIADKLDVHLPFFVRKLG
jgi:hypothetical protein